MKIYDKMSTVSDEKIQNLKTQRDKIKGTEVSFKGLKKRVGSGEEITYLSQENALPWRKTLAS